MTLRCLPFLSPLLCATMISAQTVPPSNEGSLALEQLLQDSVVTPAQDASAAASDAQPSQTSTGNPVEEPAIAASAQSAAPPATGQTEVGQTQTAQAPVSEPSTLPTTSTTATAPTTGNPVVANSTLAPAASPLPVERTLASGQAQNMRNAAATLSARQGAVSPGAGLRLEVVFGPNYPVLVCKIEMTCLIELEDGEEMLDSPLLSDPVRWEIALRLRDVTPVKTYVSLKPRPDAAQAMLSLFTNRRTYVVLLEPDMQRHTPMLAFHYPDTQARKVSERMAERKAARARAEADAKAAARARKSARAARAAKSGLPTSKGAVPADELDFNYTLRGKARFKPVRVYTDGRKTYIDLPASYRGEMPALVATAGNTNGAVNVRSGKDGQQIIADKPLDAFTLIAGRQKITVKKRTR